MTTDAVVLGVLFGFVVLVPCAAVWVVLWDEDNQQAADEAAEGVRE